MKRFRSFVIKEFQQIFRDKRTLIILLAIPIVQVLILGYAVTTEVRDVRVAVLDPSNDQLTTDIVSRFAANPYFHIEQQVQTPAEIDRAFEKGNIDLALVFPSDFATRSLQPGGASLQLITDGADPNQASMVIGYASGILAEWQKAQFGRISPSLAKKLNAVSVDTRMLYNPQAKSAYNFVPGVMGLVLMLICAMMTAIAIVREKETGTMEILLSSPMRPIYVIIAKMMPYLLLSIVDLTMVLCLAVFLMGVPINGSLTLLVVMSVLYIIVALALGLLISTVVETQQQAMLASGMGLMLPIMMLSGLLFPIESMPAPLQGLSAIVPARWYIQAVRKVMVQGVELQFVWQELTIIAGMAVLLVAVSLRKFKIRLQ